MQRARVPSIGFSGDVDGARSAHLPLLQVERAALDLGGYDDAVFPKAYQCRFDRSDIFKVLRIVLEFLGTELLDDRTGADHRIVVYDIEQFFLRNRFHDGKSPLRVKKCSRKKGLGLEERINQLP